MSAKDKCCKKAIKYIESKILKETVLGIGTGSTVNFFIEELGNLNIILKELFRVLMLHLSF